jgi:glycerate kinase
MAQVLACPDKFRGTLTAPQAAAAIAAGAARAGWEGVELPLADGGEGTLVVLGGGNQRAIVTGPLGEPVEAALRLEDDDMALIEAALACGLSLAGGPARNDPLRATSRGAGELIHAALAEGADRIVVAVGGVASTDGGLGAVEALRDSLPLPVPLDVACDVDSRFLDAADVFAPQKGATPEQVGILRERLEQTAARYREELGVDVLELPRAGAAGGLAGGLAAIGARLLPGFDLVADRLHLDERLAEADLVVTGEGRVDATSFTGKVVGQVLDRAGAAGVETLVVSGDAAPKLAIDALSLVARYGPERAFAEPAECLAELVATALATRRNGP